MSFDISAARQAGYTDNDIIDYLSQSSPNFDVKGAVASGYSLDEISNEIQSPNKKSTLDKAVEISNKVTDVVGAPGRMLSKIPGVSPILGAAGRVIEQAEKPFNIAGEAIAEKGGALASKLGIPAEVPAFLGMEAQMIPQVVMAMTGAKPGASAVAKGSSKVFQPIKETYNLLKAPGAAEVKATAERAILESSAAPKRQALVQSLGREKIRPIAQEKALLEQEIKGMPAAEVKSRQSLTSSLEKSKKSLEELESKKGLSFKELGTPEEVAATDAKSFIDLARNIAGRTPEDVLAIYPPETVQMLRKQFKMFGKTQPVEVKALVGKGEDILGKAMEKVIGEDYANARSVFKTSKEALKNLPSEFKSQKSVVGQKIAKLESEIKEQESYLKDLVAKAKQSDTRAQTNLRIKMSKEIEKATQRDAKISKLIKVGLAAGGVVGAGGGVIGLGSAIFKK